jgi:hypothetical protein
MGQRSEVTETSQLSTTPPALGDIQKQIQDKVVQLRARIAELKTNLPFTPPGILPPSPIISRTSSMQGPLKGRLGSLGILSGGRNLLRRPQAAPRAIVTGTPLSPAIVDIGPTRVSRSGASVSEEIDPTRRFALSIAT